MDTKIIGLGITILVLVVSSASAFAVGQEKITTVQKTVGGVGKKLDTHIEKNLEMHAVLEGRMAAQSISLAEHTILLQKIMETLEEVRLDVKGISRRKVE